MITKSAREWLYNELAFRHHIFSLANETPDVIYRWTDNLNTPSPYFVPRPEEVGNRSINLFIPVNFTEYREDVTVTKLFQYFYEPTKFILNSGQTYFGSSLFLADKDMNLLVIRCNYFGKLVFYLDSRIYTSSDPVEKYLRTKVLPFLVEEGYEVVIKDLSWHKVPEVTSNNGGEITQEDANLILSEHPDLFYEVE